MALFWMFCGGMALVTLTPRWVVQALADLLQGCGWERGGESLLRSGDCQSGSLPDPGRRLHPGGESDHVPALWLFPALLWRGCTWKRALAAGLCVTGVH